MRIWPGNEVDCHNGYATIDNRAHEEIVHV